MLTPCKLWRTGFDGMERVRPVLRGLCHPHLLFVIVHVLSLPSTGSLSNVGSTRSGVVSYAHTPYIGQLPLTRLSEDRDEVYYWPPQDQVNRHFKVIHMEGDHALLGARNHIYNISLDPLGEKQGVAWAPKDGDIAVCQSSQQRSDEECHNYISVIQKKSANEYYICGTGAYNPLCRTYRIFFNNFEIVTEVSGKGYSPYDPSHNSTAIAVDGQLYGATAADMSARDTLIYSKPLRTEQHDSAWLNEPDFVSSVEYKDKVYFFLRETAVEYMNCGKAVYSRVAQVCKNDRGGQRILKHTWTSFFKSRLNCSIPGEFPFYFDEIQMTTEIGVGHYHPTIVKSEAQDMLYAVFTTPPNSLPGSAICAFRMEDIRNGFSGHFKEQDTPLSNWLPVKETKTPQPHPAQQCHNESQRLSDQTLNFIKSHPLMDRAVPAFGGRPLLIQTSLNFRMTHIAVDWQYEALSGRNYDILFVGTDDGRVVKAVNTHVNAVHTHIIEDVVVFPDGSPITNIKVYRGSNRQEKLVVISKDTVATIPLERCRLHNTCGSCVQLKDPQCAWDVSNRQCIRIPSGTRPDQKFYLQSIENGEHQKCTEQDGTFTPTALPQSATTPSKSAPCQPCPTLIAGPKPGGATSPKVTTTTDRTVPVAEADIDSTNLIPNIPPAEEVVKDPTYGAVSAGPSQCTAHTLAVATVMSILLSLGVGGAAGYLLALWRLRKERADLNASSKLKPQNTYGPDPCNTIVSTKGDVRIYNNQTKPTAKVSNVNIEPTVETSKTNKVYV